ncbi:MAG: LacI family DNA-binding transcriptional regulator [Burkholderiales bacterium]|nr:LacI family DNA-binding transcriptional regulator [Burkholderiales bacterium]
MNELLAIAKPAVRAARKGSGGITLSDVAKLAGVSAITVSRALNTPERVSTDTLQRVRDAVARTGYVPNLLAGGLASNRSRLVAALIPTIAGSVFLETIQALTDSLAAAGLQLMLGQSGYTGAREDALIDTIIARRPDGIVLTGIMHSADGRRRLLASGIPVVETWDLTPTPIDMLVGFSHEKVGIQVADFLHGRGYRKPAILTADDHRAGLRRAGFQARWGEFGADRLPTCVVEAPSTLGNGRAGLRELLAGKAKVDAVFCSSDVLAQGVIAEAQARGLRVPQDVAVMGFGNLNFSADIHPALSTVQVDGAAIGEQAARFILDRIEGRDTGERVRDIGFSLVPRESA